MVSSIVTTRSLREKVQQLAHELADAHTAMREQQRTSESGQAVFRAKQMAYDLLRELEITELEALFGRSPRLIETDRGKFYRALAARRYRWRSRFRQVWSAISH